MLIVVLIMMMKFLVDIWVMDTGKYRKVVLTTLFDRPWVRRLGLVRIYVVDLEIKKNLCQTTRTGSPTMTLTPTETVTPTLTLNKFLFILT